MAVDVAVDDGVAFIALNRPPLNILTWKFRSEILAAVEAASAATDVRVIVVESGLTKAFCAGADIAEFADSMAKGGGEYRCRVEHDTYDRIEFQPKPTICAINGYCLGGGLELALAFDIRISGESAVYGQPEITLGCFPGGGGTERLALAIGRSHAKELMWTGRHIRAQQACQLGLVNRVVEDDQVHEEATALARQIASQPAEPVGYIKRLVDAAHAAPERIRGALPRVSPLVESVMTSPVVRQRAEDYLARRTRTAPTSAASLGNETQNSQL